MFTPEAIAKFNKAETKAALALAAHLDENTVKTLNDRLAELTAPPAPSPFPRQAELDEAYSEWQAWGQTIKELHAAARAGNHTFVKADGTVAKPGRARKSQTTTTGKAQIVIGERVYTSWSKAADGENVKPELSRTIARNWRPLVMDATSGTVKLTGVSVDEYLAAFPIGDGQDWSYEIA